MPTRQEVAETSEVVGTCPPHPPTSIPTLEAEKKESMSKKRKAKRECNIVVKIALKKKRNARKKKARVLCDLKTNDLHMKRINFNVCKNK